jgi:hypothetical protein
VNEAFHEILVGAQRYRKNHSAFYSIEHQAMIDSVAPAKEYRRKRKCLIFYLRCLNVGFL